MTTLVTYHGPKASYFHGRRGLTNAQCYLSLGHLLDIGDYYCHGYGFFSSGWDDTVASDETGTVK